MTPNARLAAAIEVLDRINAGEAPEPALSGWARGHRFAGSKDRAAIRDHVFDALRRRRSHAALGGAETGRGLILGACRATGTDPATVFDGVGHAPPGLDPAERTAGRAPSDGAEALDWPDWLWPEAKRSLGPLTPQVLGAMRQRAPVHLRVNLRRADRATAIARLAEDGIAAIPHHLSPTALEVTSGARRLRQCASLAEGVVELQDAASQAVCDLVPMSDGARMLDYCAGGGGKTLGVAARVDADCVAHDAHPRRMADLPARAQRAGIAVRIATPETLSAEPPFDTVLVDAPCSGSGAWRRDPHGKWALTSGLLAARCQLQAQILQAAAAHVAPTGRLVYATCSLLAAENADQCDAFADAAPGWHVTLSRSFTPLDGGDGFFVAVLERSPQG